MIARIKRISSYIKAMLWLVILETIAHYITHLNVGMLGLHGFHTWWMNLILGLTPWAVVALGLAALWEFVPGPIQRACSEWTDRTFNNLWNRFLDAIGARRLKAFIARYSD